MTGLLDGLRVVQVGGGIAAGYAGRLLVMLGADVTRLDGPDEVDAYPIDDGPQPSPGALAANLHAGKRVVDRVPDDADVILDARVRAQVAGSAFDPARLNPRSCVLASITAWGFDASEPGTIADELCVQARSGLMTITGDPGRAPLRLPGWQSQYLAGAYAAAAVLAVLPRSGFRHLDVAWVACAALGAEGSFHRFLHAGVVPEPQGPNPPVGFPSGAFPCADGYVVPGTIRPDDWSGQTEMYGLPDLREDPRFRTLTDRAKHKEELAAIVRPWYDVHTKRDIFSRGLELGVAMGTVMTAGDALDDEHLAHRRFLARRGSCVVPDRPFIVRDGGVASTRPDPKALDGVRVIELTTAWAGPFVGRFAGAFGADVVKVEAARTLEVWRAMAAVNPEVAKLGVPGARVYNLPPNFNALNRNKRGISLDLARPDGRDAFLRMVASADAVVTNLAAGVLPKLRLDHDVLREVRPDIVLLAMPALGVDGPYSHAFGYGSIMEGMGGMAARFGYRAEGARVSQTFYPDAVAGIHGAFALLAGLERRRRTGTGAYIDLSQQETLWLQLGEGPALRSMCGREPERLGNGEPTCVPSGCYPTSDGAWVALVVQGPDERRRLEAIVGIELPVDRDAADEVVSAWTTTRTCDDVMAALSAFRATRVQPYDEAYTDADLGWLFEEVEHPEAGRRPYLRVPVRVDGTAPDSVRPAPLFGQHTDEVLREWAGLGRRELSELRRSGAIVDEPSV